MTLDEVLRLVRVGDSFYRAAVPEILYERIGSLIERNGLGWATLRQGFDEGWEILAGQNVAEDCVAVDWILDRDEFLKDFDPKAKSLKLRPNFSEKTRHGWTFYDQMEPPN